MARRTTVRRAAVRGAWLLLWLLVVGCDDAPGSPAVASPLQPAVAPPGAPGPAPGAHVVRGAQDAELMARTLAEIALRYRLYLTEHLESSMVDMCLETQPKDPGTGHFCLKQDMLPGGVFPEIFNEWCVGRSFVVKEAYPHAQHFAHDPDAWERSVLERFMRANVGQDAEFGEVAEWRGRPAYRFARPILMAEPCLACHGEPAGERDPYTPWHRKEGYRLGQVGGLMTSSVWFEPE